VSIQRLLYFVAPTSLGGIERTSPTWGPRFVTLMYPYVGLLPLLLAMVGAWHTNTRRRVVLLLLAIISLGSAMVSSQMLRNVPLLNQLPGLDRWTMVLSLVMAMLAGYGLQDLGSAIVCQCAPQFGGEHPQLRLMSRALCIVVGGLLLGSVLWHVRPFTPA